MIYFDTESIGFYGPTILIQYAINDGPIYLHNVFIEPVFKTLSLIEHMAEHKGGVCGFNISHDSYHINRTYGILSQLPTQKPPSVLDYRDVEQEDICHDAFCVKPVSCLDLLAVGRKGKYQATLNQKDIVLKKVPKILAAHLVGELQSRIDIPAIYFSKSRSGYQWKIRELEKETYKEVTPEMRKDGCIIDEHFVNIRLSFNPSTALKIIVENITGNKCDTIEDMHPLPHPEEYGWFPTFGGWMDVFRDHFYAWSHDPRRLEYAKNDVEYLRIVRQDLSDPQPGDDDSELSWGVGAMYWHGYHYDKQRAREYLADIEGRISKVRVNFNAPKAVLEYLHSSCTALEKQAIPNTRKETLQNLLDWKDDNPGVYDKVVEILEARQLDKERDLLTKLLGAGRMYVNYKVVGTKSNRMAGGSESYLKRGGSINPQGIKKGGSIRSIFTLADLMDYWLSGGDFSGFEVSIAEAVYDDPELRRDLLSGKKIHALFAEAMYAGQLYNSKPINYDLIVKHSDDNENAETGWYSRGKKAFFARLYGAQNKKLMTVLWLSEEEVEAGLAKFFARYKGVKAAQDRIYQNHMALVQSGGIGTKIEWREPKKYAETFLGFRRYFTLEYSIIRSLFDIANDLPSELVEAGKKIRVIRRDRVQTGSGAACSAIYAAAFNLQSQIMRIAANNEIQSPGGQATKHVQRKIWDIQPSGVKQWLVMPMNIHDEIECPCHVSVVDSVADTVDREVSMLREKIPLIKMDWAKKLNNWGEKG